MTQILNRRTNAAVALATLADDAILSLDTVYAVLTHKAFLFEYRITGSISSALIADWLGERGLTICLTASSLSAADLATILVGAQITDTSMNRDIPERQQLFAIARVELIVITSSTDGTFEFELVFKPRSRGGIPFVEGSGWKCVIINQSGGSLTTGNNIANLKIFERFAYEGGGGA